LKKATIESRIYLKTTLLASLILVVFSCTTKKTSTDTYFGGEIINPNDDYVLLFKNEELIDTIPLDTENRFLYKFEKDVEEGLYSFTHRPERQSVIIEKGDSILMRLNTLYFDESLVFTGIGAEKNNFIIEMFLVNEDERNLVNGYYALEVNEFNAKMDSLRAIKFDQYNDLVSISNLSNDSRDITQSSIDLVYYKFKEVYPYMHKQAKTLGELEYLPEDFYTYRNNLNINDERLSYFGPYISYLTDYFNNLSYYECKKECGDKGVEIERSLHFTFHKIKLIDSLVKEKKVKDNLYRYIAYGYLRQGKKAPETNEKFLKIFNKYATNNIYAKEINDLYSSAQKLQKGYVVPKVSLVNTQGVITSSKNVIDKNTTYYFWTMTQKNHMKMINNKVLELKEKYPSHRFIGININDDQQKWLSTLKVLKINPETQFRCVSFSEVSRKFVLDVINKAIIVDGDGVIIDGFSDIFTSKYEKTISSL